MALMIIPCTRCQGQILGNSCLQCGNLANDEVTNDDLISDRQVEFLEMLQSTTEMDFKRRYEAITGDAFIYN